MDLKEQLDGKIATAIALVSLEYLFKGKKNVEAMLERADPRVKTVWKILDVTVAFSAIEAKIAVQLAELKTELIKREKKELKRTN